VIPPCPSRPTPTRLTPLNESKRSSGSPTGCERTATSTASSCTASARAPTSPSTRPNNQQGAAVDTAILVNPAIWYDADRQAGMAIHVAHNSTRAIFRASEWRRLIREPKATMGSVRKAERGFTHLAKTRARARLGKLGYDLPDVVALPGDLDRICRRGVKLLIVFAAAEIGAGYLQTFGGKVLAARQRSGEITIVDIDGGDHVFSSPGARQRLVEVVTAHLEHNFPPRPVPGVGEGGARPDPARRGRGSLLVVNGIELEEGQT
jgi:hypothetical protein